MRRMPFSFLLRSLSTTLAFAVMFAGAARAKPGNQDDGVAPINRGAGRVASAARHALSNGIDDLGNVVGLLWRIGGSETISAC
jgi:hypothetical protein